MTKRFLEGLQDLSQDKIPTEVLAHVISLLTVLTSSFIYMLQIYQ